MATFTANVVLSDELVYVIGSEVPVWAYGEITNLAVVDGDITVPSVKPPTSGAGSGRANWVLYATQQGVQFAADASVADIQAAVETQEERAAADAAAAAAAATPASS